MLSADASEITPLASSGERVAAVGALALIEAMSEGKPVPPASGPRLPLAAVQLEAPLPRPPRNVFCIGRNYRAHARELASTVFSDIAKKEDGWPIVFTKVPESVIGPGAPIRVPAGITEQVDYEAELAVVIGRGGRDIRAARALEHVWGYTIVNDVSARDVQQRHVQWDLGKSFDTFCPMGPWLVSADELDGRDLLLRCWINGELRQQARTSEMIFDIPTLIETVSRGITLYPGDVIATGTPAGVGMGFSPPQWLRSGDRVRIEIEGIGVLDNPVQ
jgi:2-keto-4-pentenoate hydratase/2-oxohepta-3-ene-1,7-dioic acid hydratase in catechol pathway